MLHSFFNSIQRFFGYVPKHRERLLIKEIIILEQQIDKIKKENEELKDESASLWTMLDEMQKSDMSQHQNSMKLLMEELQESLADEMMKDFKPIGEA
jgi:phage pi2 protein 07